MFRPRTSRWSLIYGGMPFCAWFPFSLILECKFWDVKKVFDWSENVLWRLQSSQTNKSWILESWNLFDNIKRPFQSRLEKSFVTNVAAWIMQKVSRCDESFQLVYAFDDYSRKGENRKGSEKCGAIEMNSHDAVPWRAACQNGFCYSSLF